MDSFSRTAAQLREQFESMTPSARFLAGLLLAAAVISLGVMFPRGADAPEEALFSGESLPESQLNRIEVAIAQAGLTGHRREGRRIWVPADEKPAYLAAVADADALPPNFNSMLERALDKGGRLESREATRERLKIAKQQTLSEIVRAMHWVEDAVVLYDEQEPHGLSGERQVIGSVSVKPKQGELLDPKRTQMLQTLVAHAVIGLRPDDVAVTNLGESEPLGSDASVSPAACDDGCSARIAYEQYKRQSILNALSYIPGVRVEVNAEPAEAMGMADGDQAIDVRESPGNPGEQFPLRHSSTPGGRHGTFAQGPSRPLVTEVAENQTADDAAADAHDVDGATPPESNSPRRNGFTPEQVWATITIPHDYIESVWLQHHLGTLGRPTAAELSEVQDSIIAKVERIVEPLLPRSEENEVALKLVRVVVLESVSTPDAPPTFTSQGWTWASSHGSTLAVLGLAAFGLLAVRWVFPSGREPGGKPEGSGVAEQPRMPTPKSASQLSFDDLVCLDGATLAAVIQEVEPDVMALALTGAKDELMERITGQIPPEVAKTFRQQLLRLGPTRLRDVEEAQRLVAAVAARRLDPTYAVQQSV